ncbi:hypothetical protein QFZ75_006330 [Streptomyces sp. V3I8]|uniref:hypothetical protein n=1 Tax=Streptomyces sp. V3I8 TaxID=3042279 RepID=UPI00277F3940|nr:hypothetical protein [Streptomyces sp. V3I8]MDQ1039914.1 hypothetical protein [Streptomyces sp. V3I8]
MQRTTHCLYVRGEAAKQVAGAIVVRAYFQGDARCGAIGSQSGEERGHRVYVERPGKMQLGEN